MSLAKQVNEACGRDEKRGQKNLALKLAGVVPKKLQGEQTPRQLQPA
jgi:hypothetical protein